MCSDPGPAVWSALLGACMIHKDAKLARLAFNKLLELDPENTGYYVLLSNIYSADQKYPEAPLVRQVAKKRKLVKTPGCTLIEVSETPHIFMCGDWSHPQSTAIYAELERLMGKMREAGFQSETITPLHDVEEEEKELLAMIHREKLAIAFGLIMLDPDTEIRIIKNLRVCTDCHNATNSYPRSHRGRLLSEMLIGSITSKMVLVLVETTGETISFYLGKGIRIGHE